MDFLQEIATLSRFAIMQKDLLYQQLQPVLKKCKMKNSEIILLFLLYLNPSLKTAKEICKVSEFKRGNVSVLVESLTVSGYIQQETALQDRRSRNLYLTDKAKALIEECGDAMKKMHDKMMEGISKEDLNVCSNVFSRIFENVERYSVEE